MWHCLESLPTYSTALDDYMGITVELLKRFLEVAHEQVDVKFNLSDKSSMHL